MVDKEKKLRRKEILKMQDMWTQEDEEEFAKQDAMDLYGPVNEDDCPVYRNDMYELGLSWKDFI